MQYIIEGYPGIPVGEIVSKVNRSNLASVDFFFSNYMLGTKRKDFMSQVEAIKKTYEFVDKKLCFVVLVANDKSLNENKLNKKEQKKAVNFFNWGFSILKMKKTKIDYTTLGKEGVIKKLKDLTDEE